MSGPSAPAALPRAGEGSGAGRATFRAGQVLRAREDRPGHLPRDLDVKRGQTFVCKMALVTAAGEFVRLQGDHPGRSIAAWVFEGVEAVGSRQ